MNHANMGNNHMSSPDDSCLNTHATHNASDNAISMKHNRLKPTKCVIEQNCVTTNSRKTEHQNADNVYSSGNPKETAGNSVKSTNNARETTTW